MLGVDEPLLIAVNGLPPLTVIFGRLGELTLQVIAKVNGVAVLSPLVMDTVPLDVPLPVAVHVTVNVVLLLGVTGDVGGVVTMKPDGTVGVLTVRSALPVLLIVYVSLTGTPWVVVPKSVALDVLGDAEPLVMGCPFPLRAIFGAVVNCNDTWLLLTFPDGTSEEFRFVAWF